MVMEKKVASSKATLSQSDVPSRDRFKRARMEIGECSAAGGSILVNGNGPRKIPDKFYPPRSVEKKVASSKATLSQSDVPSKDRFKRARMEIGECSAAGGSILVNGNGPRKIPDKFYPPRSVEKKVASSKATLSLSDVPSKDRFKRARMEIGDCSAAGGSIYPYFHQPTFPAGTKAPRYPWHDLHGRIDGPAAYDVLINFEQRWRKATQREFGQRDSSVDYLPSSNEEKTDFKQRASNKERTGFNQSASYKERIDFKKRAYGERVQPNVEGQNLQQEASQNEDEMQRKVDAAQGSFWFAYRTLKEYDPRGKRFDAKALKVVKSSGRAVNQGKPRIGVVPGVKVGNSYIYRAELCVIGLHRPLRAGVDFVRHASGRRIATSIVASGGYEDDMKNNKCIKYSGHGGNYMLKEKKKSDQKLEKGNLALRNSMYMKNLVRLIHKVKNSDGEDKYIYKGLFMVTKCSRKRGKHGKFLWEFKLVMIHKG